MFSTFFPFDIFPFRYFSFRHFYCHPMSQPHKKLKNKENLIPEDKLNFDKIKTLIMKNSSRRKRGDAEFNSLSNYER